MITIGRLRTGAITAQSESWARLPGRPRSPFLSEYFEAELDERVVVEGVWTRRLAVQQFKRDVRPGDSPEGILYVLRRETWHKPHVDIAISPRRGERDACSARNQARIDRRRLQVAMLRRLEIQFMDAV